MKIKFTIPKTMHTLYSYDLRSTNGNFYAFDDLRVEEHGNKMEKTMNKEKLLKDLNEYKKSPYQICLEMAGAIVHEFATFGSYQGDWFAKVAYKNKHGWVHGYYGSCSGCDAFENEFAYKDLDACQKHLYNFLPDCIDCQKKRKHYIVLLINFGESYLEDILTQEEAEKKVKESSGFSYEDEEALEWLQSKRILKRK